MHGITRRRLLLSLAAGPLLEAAGARAANGKPSSAAKGWERKALDYSIERTRRNLDLKGFPELAKNGRWTIVEDGDWVGGHWTGLLWLSFAHTRDPALRQAASEWTARLTPRQHDTSTHDLGFLFELSHILGAGLLKNKALKAPAVQAARSLTERYNDKGRFIRAQGPLDSDFRRGRAIIDTMMNLYLLYWAGRETGDAVFARIANSHASTALARQVRGDWSTAQTMEFDPDTGEFLASGTYQGFSATSCWSRGQAWAVHGYTDSFRWSRDPRFLDAARNLAAYMLRRLPPDRVAYWDFDSPLIPDDFRDSSAASILASGLLNLASVETEPRRASRWRTEALAILESLWENYSSRGTDEPSILIHGTRSKPHNFVDQGLIYGDYYFVEALTRHLAPEKLPL
jgi:unsaturated chondroitin disaccharide hydrolase